MSQHFRTVVFLFCSMIVSMSFAPPALALDDDHWRKANDAIERGIAYLRDAQEDDGSWSAEPAGPAVTAMIVAAMLERPNISADDPQVSKAIDFILSYVQDDGGIYDNILANYNTAIALTALAKVSHRPDVAEAIANAQNFIRGIQWQEGDLDPQGNPIDEDHPFYGGIGYGNHGRPDLSNVQLALQGLYDSGVDCEDEVFQRALVFLTRLQGTDENDMFDADMIERDGGFIYATSIDSDNIGTPQSMANPDMVDAGREGRAVSGLRTYGSMTYAGFKSYIYADLDRDDPRVEAARDWIAHNYTLQQNPGMPENMKHHGLYYYYHTFARAMSAWGTSTITTAEGESRDWANDLVATLVDLQHDDGSWANDADRWMEADVNLVTAYAVLALTHAVR
ncbi:prenyltransferase/squalene oxidase repeat-containing protein [Phycisphaerales bacterium AB-hyl4]|uniref:Prenyltransferase/squalene oxidase repeat-containing protein n=1 Tax=Natronomicrosphaera hydrolytica TaxID=3242702 RepID=A0ABV4U4B9_9BACT